jgi:hypothetical protein
METIRRSLWVAFASEFLRHVDSTEASKNVR